MKKLFILLVAVAGFSVSSYSQVVTKTVAGTASATIFTSITLIETAPLNFGAIQSTGVASEVTLDTNDGATVTLGTATLFGTFGAAVPKSGRFLVGGTPNATYTVQVPANNVVTLSGIGTPMKVKNFTYTPLAASLKLDAALGTQEIQIGAVLEVGVSQTAGTYSGSYDVTVAYN